MRWSIYVGVCFFIPALSFAQPQSQNVTSSIEDVMVFTQGAQITRTASVRVGAGTTDLVFAGLTPYLWTNQIQAAAQGNVTVLSVTHRENFLESPVTSAAVEGLRNQIVVVRDSLALEGALVDVYQQEEAMLLANRAIGGTDTGVPIAALKEATDYFRQRLTEIKTEQLRLQQRIRALNERLEALNRQLNELQGSLRQQPTSEITVTVQADAPTTAALTLEYITPQAGWSPRYDLRVEDVNSPVALSYKANVYQRTGIVWDNVDLTLSTGNPSQSGTKPELQPWRVSFLPARKQNEVVAAQAGSAVRSARPRAMMQDQAEADEAFAAPPPVQTMVNVTTVDFAIAIPYTIQPDGQPSNVHIQQHQIPAAYAYYAVPKLDRDAFLTAKITGWEDYHLLSGEANLFLAGVFVGTSHLDMANVQDTLVVSLGRDKGVVVERTQRRDFTKRTFFRDKQVESFAYDIEVRNTKGAPIELVIEDNVPVTTDDDLDVRVKPGDGAQYNKQTGVLQWRLVLPPGASERVSFEYELRYPVGEQLVGH